MNGRYVSYIRVSTKRQGESGLGLEAQQEAVNMFVVQRGGEIMREFREVESGKNDEREQLHAAMDYCRVYRATLVIARLDRLSRSASFLLTLRDGNVPFVAVDMPDANNLTVGIMALVAQDEAERISSRTRAALRASQARGKQLGGWRGGPKPDDGVRARSATARASRARDNALIYSPIIAEILDEEGQDVSNRHIAKCLNARQVPTVSGKRGDNAWSSTQVQRIRGYIGEVESELL